MGAGRGHRGGPARGGRLLLLGVQDLAPGAVLDALRGAQADGETAAIVSSRVDRTVVALVVGASVALSGVVLQGLTRNPIAEPGILGLNSGAALAVVLGIRFLGLTTVTGYVVAALVGTLVVAALVQSLTAMAPRSSAPVAMALPEPRSWPCRRASSAPCSSPTAGPWTASASGRWGPSRAARRRRSWTSCRSSRSVRCSP